MVYIVVILVVLVADLIIKAKILEIPEAGFPIEKFKIFFCCPRFNFIFRLKIFILLKSRKIYFFVYVF